MYIFYTAKKGEVVRSFKINVHNVHNVHRFSATNQSRELQRAFNVHQRAFNAAGMLDRVDIVGVFSLNRRSGR